MNTINEKQRLCGTRVFNASNCHNKIRKVSHNKFERILLYGKHAFNYSVITENKSTGEIKEIVFPTRKQALIFFAISVKKYDDDRRRIYT